jgi:hypothetical protein
VWYWTGLVVARPAGVERMNFEFVVVPAQYPVRLMEEWGFVKEIWMLYHRRLVRRGFLLVLSMVLSPKFHAMKPLSSIAFASSHICTTQISF